MPLTIGFYAMWLDDPHLSGLIADILLCTIGDPNLQRMERHVLDVLDQVDYQPDDTELIRAGGCAEGISVNGADVDQMYVDKRTKVVVKDSENIQIYMAVVKMIKNPEDPAGYVRLLVLTPHSPLEHIKKSTKMVSGEYYLSSETFVKLFKRSFPDGILHGPCVMESANGTEQDRAFCLEYKDWPSYANEWIRRERSFGWPSVQLISKIKSQGCHLMATGSKQLTADSNSDGMKSSIWRADPLQWRISFSVAEKRLIYAFNNTQFLTYGILKLLNQEVFSQDQIIKDCICSYFLKTLVFWTIEETPSDYWKPERFVFCVDLCFQRLIEWTRNGFCPNYFIRENNMFLGKVEEWQLEYAASKLYELHNEGWRCLLRCHSLNHLKKALEGARQNIKCNLYNKLGLEDDFRILRSTARNVDETKVEARIDAVLFSKILSRVPKFTTKHVLESELRNSLALEFQEKFDTLDMEILRLRRFHNLCQLALVYFKMSLTEKTTRRRYVYIRKAFCYLHLVRLSDISRGNLTLATAYFWLGRFDLALKYIKKYDDILEEGLGCIHFTSHFGDNYTDFRYHLHFCGHGLRITEKLPRAVSYGFAVYRSMPLIPNEIALEAVMMRDTDLCLFILPEIYSAFLKILCFTEMGNLKMATRVSIQMNDILQCTADNKSRYLNYIMLAVTFGKLGNYEEALRCYCLAHIYKRRLVLHSSDIPEWQTSVLFYIAQMFQSLMPV